MIKIRASNILKEVSSKNKVLDYNLGNKNLVLNGFSSITKFKKNTISWARNSTTINHNLFEENLIILEKNHNLKNIISNFIEVENAREVFFLLMKKYTKKKKLIGIDSNSFVSKKAKIGKNVYIGAYTFISDNVEIGDDTTILNGVVILDNVKIGSNCFIKNNTVIGEDGFGVAKDENGDLFDFPHLGGVLIGDNVRIGSLNTIAAGTLDPTIIDNFVKIDDQVHIAHNVNVGESVRITASVVIGGSVIIEENVWIGLGSVLTDGIKILSGAFIGAGVNVLTNIGKNVNIIGTPGRQLFKKG